jgi:hypothetical protein
MKPRRPLAIGLVVGAVAALSSGEPLAPPVSRPPHFSNYAVAW